MASFISTLLAQAQSNTLQTRKALIVLGLQNDFVSSDGNLVARTETGFLDRIKELVPVFREYGNVIWVRSEFGGNRPVNDPSGSGCMVVIGADTSATSAQTSTPPSSGEEERRAFRGTSGDNPTMQRVVVMAEELELEEQSEGPVEDDPELFLSETDDKPACCKPGTWGADFPQDIKDLVDPKDMQITKSYYSAFTNTPLLLRLRSNLITELYFVGCNTNLSVYATAMDVARHGMSINIVEDCLGCWSKQRHDQAVDQMVSQMGAYQTTKASLISRLRGEAGTDESDSTGADDSHNSADEHSPPVRQPPLPDVSRDNVEFSTLKGVSSLTTGKPGTSPERSEPTSNEWASSNVQAYTEPAPSSAQLGQKAQASDGLSAQRQTRKGGSVGASHTDVRQLCRRTEVTSARGREEQPKPEDGFAPALEPRSSGHMADFVQESPRKAVVRREEPPAGEPHATTAHTQAHDQMQKSGIAAERRAAVVARSTTPQLSSCGGADHAGGTPARSALRSRKRAQSSQATLGPGDTIGSGDSYIVYDLLPSSSSQVVFQNLYHEVHWQRMYHAAGEVPRLVCTQGDTSPVDGSMPVYRHPSDASLPLLRWSPTVSDIRLEVEKRVGHRLNHVLIQLYRSGQDYISEHSDKTLDIVRGSSIVNVSYGAQRTMRLRTKRPAREKKKTSRASNELTHGKEGESATSPSVLADSTGGQQRTTQRFHMAHNSMFVMGLSTNCAWLHGINPDKRLAAERSAAELAYGGMRISLTFRNIGTFLSPDSKRIWGQGAVAKQEEHAGKTINGVQDESQRLIDAFGFENQSTDFDWQATYGAGFDVLHLKEQLPEKEMPLLFLSDDTSANKSIQLFLNYLHIPHLPTTPPSQTLAQLTNVDGTVLPPPSAPRRELCFRDTDPLHTQIQGLRSTLLYLDRHHRPPNSPTSPPQRASELEHLHSQLLFDLRRCCRELTHQEGCDVDLAQIWPLLQALDHELERAQGLRHQGRDDGELDSARVLPPRGDTFLAGSVFGVADCAVLPLVWALRRRDSQVFEHAFPRLGTWLEMCGERHGVFAVLEAA